MAKRSKSTRGPKNATTPKTTRKSREERTPSDLDNRELESVVCYLVCMGKKPTEIVEEINRQFKGRVKITRERPYAIVREVGEQGRFHYQPRHHFEFQQRIKRAYTWLSDVEVVHTAVTKDVARDAAIALRGLVQERHRRDRDRNEVHIGFAAGISMRHLAQAFAALLCEPADDMPARIYFHAMVTGHEPNNPTTDPNAFLTFFLNHPIIRVEPCFVALPHRGNPGGQGSGEGTGHYRHIRLGLDGRS
jgi:hypothetical protein